MRLISVITILFMVCIPANAVSHNRVPTPNFSTPKNIAFASSGGGSSHHMWVFEILKEMHSRGHSISFFSRGDQLRFAKDYPIKTVKEVGGASDFLHHPTLVLKHIPYHPHAEIVANGVFQSAMLSYPIEYNEYKLLFESQQIDLVICDYLTISCIDAAIVSKIPVMITSTMGTYADSDARYISNRIYNIMTPTTEYDSLFERVYRDYVRLPILKRYISKKLAHITDLQRKNGLSVAFETGDARYNHIPKLINNIFGIEMARKHSPLSHMIGPIMRGSYPPLDPITAEFLNNHKKVVYIAFGQHFNPNKNDVKMFLQTLFTMIDEEIIDGIIWARIDQSYIPDSIETPKCIYNREDIVNHKDLYLVKWAPQYAILEHAAVSFFISHGGIGSLHESLYNGVRVFLFPFFGDQVVNAIAVEKTGIGSYMGTSNLKYDAKDYLEFYKKLQKVAVDPGNKIQDTVNRYKVYVQISGANAVTRGADLMEESLFASDSDGNLQYRQDVGYNIHWIKRNDFDVYAVLVLLGLATLKASHTILNFLKAKYVKYQKLKTL
ncbi:hypothetical protein EDC94DRAFT_603488 [Helicostylum pulchrum]|nr:hypothetical protein EDC94DRAFT_603488 [Helicostylum pulchrum]